MEKPELQNPETAEKKWEGTPSFENNEDYISLRDLEDQFES